MTVIEYGKDKTHPTGFCGLRVEVKKISAKPYYKYMNFKGKSQEDIAKMKAEADSIDAKETLDQQLRKKSMLINTPSRSPLSCVYGISVTLVSRAEPNGGYRHELIINVAGLSSKSRDASGSVGKYTKSTVLYDYLWYQKSWKEACKVRAKVIGLKRTPSQWLKGIASEKEVDDFLQLKIKEKVRI